jgi:Ca-activated chloride channel homolog
MSNNSLCIKIQTDLDLIPCQTASQRILEVAVQAPDSPKWESRQRLNLALVLDRSGSMSGAKLEYVKQAAEYIVDQLENGDRLTLVTFDDQVDTLIPGRLIDSETRSECKHLIRRLKAGNMTNLSGGWLAGCQGVAEAVSQDKLNRALLLTDGLANYGITDAEVLFKHAQELSQRGVTTSTFGVGEGFNEHLLEGMANQGSGNYYFVGSPAEIPSIFAREFTEIAAVTAREVELEIETVEGVNCQVLGEWRSRIEKGLLRINLGALYGGRKQEVYLKLLIPPANGKVDLLFHVKVHATGLDEQPMMDQSSVRFLYKDQDVVESTPPRREVLARFAKVEMAQVTSEALKLERRGETDQAKRMVLLTLSEHDASLEQQDKVQYQKLAERMERGMDEYDRKQTHYQSYRVKRRREE